MNLVYDSFNVIITFVVFSRLIPRFNYCSYCDWRYFALQNKHWLVKYFEMNNLLSTSQLGFRLGKSTADAVQDIMNFVTSNLDCKHRTLAIFLDLTKAFGTVLSPVLLNKTNP